MPKAFALIFILFIYASCNINNKDLLGVYIINKVKGDTTSQNHLKELHLKKNGIAELIYGDTIILGEWDETDWQEMNFIELNANGELKQLEIEKRDNSILLYLYNPTNFRGGFYDSLSFRKVK